MVELINIMKLLVFVALLGYALASELEHNFDAINKGGRSGNQRSTLPGPPILADPRENETSYWVDMAQSTLASKLGKRLNKNMAKNVIFFLGDGLSISTLAATRLYVGQQNRMPGEETVLSFEEFPYVGLAKTYCLDYQVPDSACTATAYLSGVKANLGTEGVNGYVGYGDCLASADPANHVNSVARWFQLAGRKSGLITTSRVTHASPGPLYAHSSHRDWESDTDILLAGEDPNICPDIASQLIDNAAGQGMSVIMGGGRGKFVPNNVNDISGSPGQRSDGRNLVNEWLAQKSGDGVFVSNKVGLDAVDTSNTEYLMGLFGYSHLQHNLDKPASQPSLAEMTEAAIKVLDNANGYFLFVENGHIDTAHHMTTAVKALDETAEFAKAVEKALELTDSEDTLIVVTSDHSHTMTLNGYQHRGHDVFGFGDVGDDGKPYASLSYANGPAAFKQDPVTGDRYDLTNDDLSDKDYMYPSYVPTFMETHAGDDVAVFCKGPWAHLCTGVIEQNLIPHIVAYAACVGEGRTSCDCSSHPSHSTSAAPSTTPEV